MQHLSDPLAAPLAAPNIFQIMPSDGWRAVFIDDYGRASVRLLVCWALMEHEGSRAVQGLAGGLGGVGTVEQEANFIGYVDGRSSQEEWQRMAEQYTDAHGGSPTD